MAKTKKINLYKIKRSNLEILQGELEAKGLELIGENNIEDHVFKLFFGKKDKGGNIWWIDQYKQIFDELDSEEYTRSNISGALLIIYKEYIYAISYGNAYFYLQKYCEYNFGLDLAERLVDSTGVQTKVSKYFNINKSKELVVYNNNINLEFDNGEATFYVQAKPIDTAVFGKMVKFGYSASFQLNLNPKEMVAFIKCIEKYLTKEPQFKVPRVKVLNEKLDNELIRCLNNELYDRILEGDENVRFEYIGLIGTDLITEDNLSYFLYIKGKGNERIKVETLDVDTVKKFIIRKSISSENISRIMVKYETESSNSYSRNLGEIVDYTIEKEGNYYCIVNGKWAEFNESYIEYLRKNLDEISKEVLYCEKYNFKKSSLDALRKEHQGDSLNYNEYIYNKYYMSEYGYQCYDRDFIKYGNINVELGDLYKEGILYHVKIGTNGELIYAIDQSNMSIKVLRDTSKKEVIEEKLNGNVVKGIGLVLILETKSIIKNNRINLNNIRSVIFKMKIMDWYNNVKRNNFTPKLLINFKEQ